MFTTGVVSILDGRRSDISVITTATLRCSCTAPAILGLSGRFSQWHLGSLPLNLHPYAASARAAANQNRLPVGVGAINAILGNKPEPPSTDLRETGNPVLIQTG